MSNFDTIRARVSASDAYARYAGPVQRGKALCIWHNDRHPSLSFKGAFCKYFACGGGGSAIDVVMHLYGLDARGAAKRINLDFALGLDFDTPVDARAVAQARNDRAVIQSDQEKLVSALTKEINGRLRFRYGWGCVLILETGLRTGEALR